LTEKLQTTSLHTRTKGSLVSHQKYINKHAHTNNKLIHNLQISHSFGITSALNKYQKTIHQIEKNTYTRPRMNTSITQLTSEITRNENYYPHFF
jgi:hypothetical protein